MKPVNHRLNRLKLLHTVIWVFFASLIFYIDWTAITNQVTSFTWIAIGLVMFEVFVLLFYQWTCPITIVARNYSVSEKDNFDIFLPNWIARHNKTIFGSLYVGGVLLVLIRYFYSSAI